MYALVQNGAVVSVGLPSCGCINGAAVSNYNLLPEATLVLEGWLPYTEDIPEYNVETQMLKLNNYEILANEVIGHYTITVLSRTAEQNITALYNSVGEILEEVIPAVMMMI